MNYYVYVKPLEEKLREVLAEQKLIYTFQTRVYPATIVITRNQDPGEQLALYEVAEGGISGSGAVLRLIFRLSGLEVQADNKLVLPEEALNKIKTAAKKLHNAYCQAYFAERQNPIALAEANE